MRHVSLCQLWDSLRRVGPCGLRCTRGLMHEHAHVLQHMSYTHLLVHGWQVPHITDKGPAGHHPQQVIDHTVLGTVPESISKLWVILKSKKINKSIIYKRAVKNSNAWVTCWEKRNRDVCTLMATGYMVDPISKLPFLNIMTDVLLTQVPVKTIHCEITGDWAVWALSKPTWSSCSFVIAQWSNCHWAVS